MIKLVTFDNSFPPLRHSRRMTTANAFSSQNAAGSHASNTQYWVLKTTNCRCCRSILWVTLGVHVFMPPRERTLGAKLSRTLSLGTHQHFAIDFISSVGRAYALHATRSYEYLDHKGWTILFLRGGGGWAKTKKKFLHSKSQEKKIMHSGPGKKKIRARLSTGRILLEQIKR